MPGTAGTRRDELSGDRGYHRCPHRHRDVAVVAREAPARRSGPAPGGGVMSPRAHCEKLLMVQADFDGELDAVQSLTLTQHREDCAICRLAWQQLRASRQSMRDEASYHRAPVALRQRLAAELEVSGIVLAPAPGAPAMTSASLPAARLAGPREGLAGWRQRLAAISAGWRATMGVGLGTAAAAMAAILLLTPAPAVDITGLVLASHLR